MEKFVELMELNAADLAAVAGGFSLGFGNLGGPQFATAIAGAHSTASSVIPSGISLSFGNFGGFQIAIALAFGHSTISIIQSQ
jgi:hypothetical protein